MSIGALAVVVTLTACRGGGSPSALRTENGPTSTAVAGAAPVPGQDGTAEGIAGTPAPGGAQGAGVGAGASRPVGTGAGVPGQPAAAAGAGGAGGQPAPTVAASGGSLAPAPAASVGGTAAATSSASATPAASSASSGGTPAVSPGASQGPGDLAAFCPAERTLESRLAAIDVNAGPGPLQASVTSARAAFGPVTNTAPPDIRADVATVVDAYERLFAAIDEAGYDISKVSIGALQSFSPSTVTAASSRLFAYADDRC